MMVGEKGAVLEWRGASVRYGVDQWHLRQRTTYAKLDRGHTRRTRCRSMGPEALEAAPIRLALRPGAHGLTRIAEHSTSVLVQFIVLLRIP